MKKIMFTVMAALSLSSTARADCWMECVARNPLSGGCVARTKLCNVEDARQAAATLGRDIGVLWADLRGEWRRIYGDIPQPLRTVLDRYPVTFVTTIFPETRAYSLAIMAVENLVTRAKDRSRQSSDLLVGNPDWKADLNNRAQALILTLDLLQTSRIDYNDPAAEVIPDRYHGAWSAFLACLTTAPDRVSGEECLYRLQVEASAIR